MKNFHRSIEGGDTEISRMTADLDALHHDVGMPALTEAVGLWSDEIQETRTGRRRSASRRAFLLGTGGAVASGAAMLAVAGVPGLAAATAGSGSSGGTSGGAANPPNSRGGITGLTGDLAVAALAASLENLAVYAYNAGISAATAGKLGPVPPAVVTFATTAKAQHSQHAAAWNSILTASGKQAVTVTEPALTPTVLQKFGQVTDIVGLAELALLLETIAAQTYQVQASKLSSKKAIETAATIQPVEMQHVAILYFALGKYPGVQSASGAPMAFNPTSSAA